MCSAPRDFLQPGFEVRNQQPDSQRGLEYGAGVGEFSRPV